MHWDLLLPFLLAGVLVAVFLVLIAAGRPQGFVRVASAVSGIAVLVLGLLTVGLWAGGGLS